MQEKFSSSKCPNCGADLSKDGAVNVVSHLAADGTLLDYGVVKCAECAANIEIGEAETSNSSGAGFAVLRRAAKEAYLAAKGSHCPFCKSTETDGGKCEVDGPQAIVNVECSACGKTWIDAYALVGIGSSKWADYTEEPDAAKSWANSKGVDAETLIYAAYAFGSGFWLNRAASDNHSITCYTDFVVNVCLAFQKFYAAANWAVAGNYWDMLDPFMEVVKVKAAAADGFFAWTADEIVEKFTRHVCPVTLRLLTKPGVSGDSHVMYYGLNGNWLMTSDGVVNFQTIPAAEAVIRAQPRGAGSYEIIDYTGKYIVMYYADVPLT